MMRSRLPAPVGAFDGESHVLVADDVRQGDKFYGLLEASADAARQSTRALTALLNAPVSSRSPK